MTGLTSTVFLAGGVSVCSSRSLIAPRPWPAARGRFDSIRRQPRSSGELMTVSMRSATSSFKILFSTRGVLVEHVDGDHVAVPVDGGSGTPPPAGGGSRLAAPLAAAGTASSNVLRPAQVHVLATKKAQRLEGTRGRATSPSKTRGAGGSPPAASTAPTSTRRPGRRHRAGSGILAIHRSKPHWPPCPGRTGRKMSCRAAGSSQEANPLDKRG